ncbi:MULTISPECIES: glucose 1-dehydrogenase [unclassified Thioalkalivibrio]|uniref:SDR family oxidoreductase n=1 Tax=unclassified Thioalkalivibrio TaxID=2621013 RepID=UPI00036ED1A6|nr:MULTISPECIES: glucose 1-dehydrogenase [unclassified Thioalkalivibrio]
MVTASFPDLAGQRVLVTGGGSGIGAAIARAMAGAGAWVAISDLGAGEHCDATRDAIQEGGGEAMTLQADVSDEAQVQALFRQVVDTWGGLDTLVNNAGIQQDATFSEMTLAQWQKVLDVNLTGQFLCAREAIRTFRQQGTASRGSRAKGCIVCMSSVHDTIPWAGHTNYAVSKAGVLMLVRSLAQEMAHLGIRVNGVSPGAIRTAINREAWSDPEAEATLRTLIPYDRVGDPDDVAAAVLWLSSDASDYVNGTTLYVDGGMSLYPGFRDNG